jgi:hypothetical protein
LVLVEIVLDFLVIYVTGEGKLVNTIDEEYFGDFEWFVIPILHITTFNHVGTHLVRKVFVKVEGKDGITK